MTPKYLGSAIVLLFAKAVGGLEAWVCAGIILWAVWTEPPATRQHKGES